MNRTTAHIAGFDASATAGHYTLNHCAAVTRSNLARTGKTHTSAADALAAAARTGRKVCKNCERAALARIELDQAPAVTAVALPQGVTMDETTRVLSGPVRHMRALWMSDVARLTADGDLVLI